MCTGLEIAALALAGGGAGAQVAGANNTAKGNAAAMDAQTRTSAKEFDTRNALAKDIFAENSQVSADTYNQMATLSDQEFQARTGLSKDQFNGLNRIQQDQVARDFQSAQANVDQGRAIREGTNATRDAAREQYLADVAAANGKQDAFRKQGDTVASDLVAAFTPEAMAARQQAAQAERDALVAKTNAPVATQASATAKDNVRAAFDRYSAAGKATADARTGAQSKIASMSDAVTQGGRAIDAGNERTAFLRDSVARALSPLSAVLDTSSQRYANAAASGQGRQANADADLNAALGLSSTQAGGDAKALSTYTGAMDNAYDRYYGGRQSSTATRGDTLINANQTKLAGSNAASSAFENNMNNITNFRMANNGSTLSQIGQLASAFAPTLLNIGQRNKFSKEVNAGTP